MHQHDTNIYRRVTLASSVVFAVLAIAVCVAYWDPVESPRYDKRQFGPSTVTSLWFVTLGPAIVAPVGFGTLSILTATWALGWPRERPMAILVLGFDFAILFAAYFGILIYYGWSP